jgi:hypothetical protein
MLITTAAILLLAILLVPVLLIRFRKKWVAAFASRWRMQA